ncbi:MAG TPA: nicotinate (nicotinamide) nucleotide adenylyltransferase [Bacteroidia bacterium]|jgi:nicotinate-nucleotide adenylyltransferase|nr:nicotinate (nicotinamide) nucleotide adenylyltransferase [Bacteroidia bacterium]
MKIGLFFGSFNPIHIGHLALANYMLEYAGLDRVWFVVSPHNPLKDKKTLLSDLQRLQMVRLAIGDDQRMKASNIEFNLPQPSYTVNTLAYIKEKFPNDEFVLIMGSDNLESFHKWKNADFILDNYKICVYPRPGHEGGDLAKHPSVIMTKAPQMEISASFLRDGIKQNKDLSRFFTPEVWSYLKTMDFYKK